VLPSSSDLTFVPAKAGTQFSNPGGMQGWVDLGGDYAKDDHLSQKLPGSIMAGDWTYDWKLQEFPNLYTTKPPSCGKKQSGAFFMGHSVYWADNVYVNVFIVTW